MANQENDKGRQLNRHTNRCEKLGKETTTKKVDKQTQTHLHKTVNGRKKKGANGWELYQELCMFYIKMGIGLYALKVLFCSFNLIA